MRDGQRVGPHVCVERRTKSRRAAQNVLRLAAVDVELHPVIVPGLPEEADLGNKMPLLPPFIVPNQIGQEINQKRTIGMNLINGPDGIRQPGTVVAWLGSGGPEPVTSVISRNLRLPQPASLVELVASRTTDGTIGS